MNTTELLKKLFVGAVALAMLSAPFPAYATQSAPSQPNNDSSNVLRDRIRSQSTSFKDLTATVVVEHKNDRVLAKIDKHYASQYSVRTAKVRFKVPDSIRIEGVVSGLNVIYITNNKHKILRIKAIRYQKKELIGDRPRDQEYAMLLGLVAPDLWDQYVIDDKGIRCDGDRECHVLDLARTGSSQRLCRLLIDSKMLTLTECEFYSSTSDTPKFSYRYLEPIQVNGLWVPAKVEMHSSEGELAVAFRLKEVTVNTGLDDTLFQ